MEQALTVEIEQLKKKIADMEIRMTRASKILTKQAEYSGHWTICTKCFSDDLARCDVCPGYCKECYPGDATCDECDAHICGMHRDHYFASCCDYKKCALCCECRSKKK